MASAAFDTAATLRWRSTFARARPSLALSLSVTLHLIVVYSASRIFFATPEIRPQSPATVVWLREPFPVEPEPASEAAVEPAPPAPPLESRSADAPEPSAAADSSEPRSREAPSPDEAEAVAEPAAPAAEAPRAPRVPTGVDLDEERRRAVASVIEQRERERSYVTFSLADVLEDPPPPADESPPASSYIERCPVVSGKMKLFAMMLVGRCARLEARSDLFAHIRPAYLDMRPLCVEVPTVGDVGTAATTAVKCRLATEEEIAQALFPN